MSLVDLKDTTCDCHERQRSLQADRPYRPTIVRAPASSSFSPGGQAPDRLGSMASYPSWRCTGPQRGHGRQGLVQNASRASILGGLGRRRSYVRVRHRVGPAATTRRSESNRNRWAICLAVPADAYLSLRISISAFRSGTPRPVTASQPGPAVYAPFDPLVTSRMPFPGGSE